MHMSEWFIEFIGRWSEHVGVNSENSEAIAHGNAVKSKTSKKFRENMKSSLHRFLKTKSLSWRLLIQ